MNLSSAEKVLLYSSKFQLSAEEIELLNNSLTQIDNWEELAELLVKRGIAPLLYAKRASLPAYSGTSEDFRLQIESAYSRTLMRGMVLYGVFAEFAGIFASQGIQFIPLKGVLLSEWLYTDIALRMFSDIDILVRPHDAAKAIEILGKLGYKPHSSSVSAFIEQHEEVVHYPPMCRGGFSVEVHVKLHRSHKNHAMDAALLFANAVPHKLYNQEILLPGIDDILIHQCVHAHKHFEGGNMGFRSFTDIAN